jgi:hypothetical protein
MGVVQAQDHDFEPWLELAGEAAPLFGPLVRDDRFLDALRKNIARGSAFCVRAGEGGAGTPLLGGLLWSAIHRSTKSAGSSFRHRAAAAALGALWSNMVFTL